MGATASAPRLERVQSEVAATEAAVLEQLLRRSAQTKLVEQQCAELESALGSLTEWPEYESDPECRGIVNYYRNLSAYVRALGRAKAAAPRDSAAAAEADRFLRALNRDSVLQMTNVDGTLALLDDIEQYLGNEAPRALPLGGLIEEAPSRAAAPTARRQPLPRIPTRPRTTVKRAPPTRAALTVQREQAEERDREAAAEELLQLEGERLGLIEGAIDELQERIEAAGEQQVEEQALELSPAEFARIERTLAAGEEKIRELRAEVTQLRSAYDRCVTGGADVELINRVLTAGEKLSNIDSAINTLQSVVGRAA